MAPESSGSQLIDQLHDALRTVIDPEAGMNIVELGLVYRLEIEGGQAHVDLTLTSPTCPMGDMILEEAREALAAVLPESVALDLQLVWEPPWGPERMSDRARQHFGWQGD